MMGLGASDVAYVVKAAEVLGGWGVHTRLEDMLGDVGAVDSAGEYFVRAVAGAVVMPEGSTNRGLEFPGGGGWGS